LIMGKKLDHANVMRRRDEGQKARHAAKRLLLSIRHLYAIGQMKLGGAQNSTME